MITARYMWNVETVEPGFRIHYRSQRWTKVIPIISVLAVAFGIYRALTAEHSWLEAFPYLCFGAVLLVVIRPAAFRQFRRSVRRSPSYGAEMTWAFDPQQVVLTGAGFHSTFTWKTLYSATVSASGLLLYPQKGLFHWIPASSFTSSEDFATVCSYLSQNAVATQNA